MAERICIYPKVGGLGGMASFLLKFSDAAQKHGVGITFDLTDEPYSAVLVIGGTREILPLWRRKQRGVRVVQRLDGINWIYRKNPVSWKHSIRSEYGNFVLAFIRRFVADRIVYQSEFSRVWWNDWFGALDKPYSVIWNGVDLAQYAPVPGQPLNGPLRLLVVEGSMGGGYEGGLSNAVRLAEAAAPLLSAPLELVVAGEVPSSLQAAWTANSAVPIVWAGKVPRAEIPALMNSAHALFSADVHPACPNSVIEALACGLPVVAYDTGSLTELVTPQAGFIAPYGGDAWNLDTPAAAGLAPGLARVLMEQESYRRGARSRAESVFGLDAMAAKYLDVLLG